MKICKKATSSDPCLLDRIENLPLELIDFIIEASIFSEPKGSHEALHTIMKLHRVEVGTVFKSRIETVFNSRSLQNHIIANWKMFPDFSRGEKNRLTVDEHASYDLASWSIRNCSECFQFLLRQHAITASYFCHTGESFYWIAWKDHNLEQGAVIVASMSDEHLFQPFLIDRLGEHSKSIFQSSTWSEPWFRICWDRVKTQSRSALSSLGTHEIGQICRFADPGLAQELLDHGLELGKVHTGYKSPWIYVMAQKDPEPMFEWLWENDYRPPEHFLESATRNYCTKAAGWIISHTEYQDWCQALLFAAGYTNERSVELFQVLIQQEQFPLRTRESFVCDILIRLVDEVCAASQQYHEFYQGAIFPQWRDDPTDFNDTISNLQEVAVRKIEAVNQLVDGVGVVGMKVKTRHAGLHQVMEALENLDR
ncbi:hypothetical protein N7508_007159 [Penicillium antarcticum]|uniref:uncharacterized protein n=1 Tax=Penicillium antarcticum TaxID=416450 RepID=UPI00238A761E|nr:uncharacterized protein N7508_007159 [Penicillium antarcticum]KAJ5302296.1 hypothetical protein N7508_007159 [Penicillium antarcticum]